MKIVIAWDESADIAIEPQRAPSDGEWCRETDTDRPRFSKKYQYNAPRATSVLLAEAKTARIARVKLEAGERISALDWQLQRADRHTELNKTPKKARAIVLTAQQKTEDDSDLAEIAINSLTAIEEVNAFNW